MAKRKGWQKALSGLGEGIGNASQLALRQGAVDRQNAAIMQRQKAIDDQNYVETLTQAVAQNRLSPEQAVAQAQMRGIQLPVNALQTVRPDVRSRMSVLDKPIMDAKTPEDVPSLADIIGTGQAQDAFGIPTDMMVPDALTDDPSAAGSAPMVGEYANRAETRRRSLMSRPSEKVDAFNPVTMANETRFVSPYTSGAIQSGPTPEQLGRKQGIAKTIELGESGDALATQAGKEAKASGQAREDVTNDPLNVKRQVGRAFNIAQAESNARFPNELAIAQARAAIDVQNATDKEVAKNLSESMRAAQTMRGFFDKFKGLSDKINTHEGVTGRGVGLFRAGQALLGDDPDVTQMQQLISQNLRPLAVLMGVREANVSETETKQALAGIGVKPWSTHTEAVNALRNLQDVIDMAPIVAARATSTAGIGERMALVTTLSQQRRQAEQEAIAAGYSQYIDPVTQSPRTVIK